MFLILWSRAIPGEQKIKEIQEGIRPDFADVIHDNKEIQKINFNLIKSAKKGILVLFLTINAFHQHTQLMQLFKEAAKERGVKIRIMMPMKTLFMGYPFNIQTIGTSQKIIFQVTVF